MSISVIKNNDVIYLKKYPRGCAFKLLRLRTNTRHPDSIYRVEILNKAGESIVLGANPLLKDADRLYQDIATLSPSEVEAAFSSML